MLPESFRTAMLNRLRIGPYETPDATNDAVLEWLIVERSGRYLFISDTATAVDGGTDHPPDDLLEQNTLVGSLAEADADAARFLILRHLPGDVTVPGRFFPADGSAEIRSDSGVLRLSTFGRHAHSRGQTGGQVVLHDIPHPAPNAEGALNWHFQAEERAWSAASPERTFHDIQ